MTLTTLLVGLDETLFEPCRTNPQARILCPGVVRLHQMANENQSIFTLQYINKCRTQEEGIEVETDKTIGAVQQCRSSLYAPELPVVASVTQRSDRPKVAQEVTETV